MAFQLPKFFQQIKKKVLDQPLFQIPGFGFTPKIPSPTIGEVGQQFTKGFFKTPEELGQESLGTKKPAFELFGEMVGTPLPIVAAGVGIVKQTPRIVTKIGKAGKIAEEIKPILDPVQKVITALKEAKPIRGSQEALYSAERAKRVAKAAAMGEKIPGEQGFFAQLGQLKGQLPKVQFEGIRNKLTTEDITGVFNKIEQVPYFSLFEKITAKTGLAKLLGKEGGIVPNKSELKLLNEIFPPEFIKAIQGNRTLLQKVLGGIGQIAAIPRSLMAGGFDMSYPLRQGIFSGYSHPKEFASAFKEQFKYFISNKTIQELSQSIKSNPNYKLAREAGVQLTDVRPGEFALREEPFQSQLAEKIPIIGKFVKASARAYTGFSNKYRFDIFNNLVTNAKKTGDFEDPNFLKSAGELVNTLTGRGSLGVFENQAGILTTTLFSPRLLASRIQLMNPQFYIKLQPAVRKEALKSLLGYIAGTSTILGAAKLAGADVGTDMTSSDWGKIKVGDTRIDIMGGFQQPLILLARLITGRLTSSVTGKQIELGEGYKPATRFDIVQRFFESKEAPIVSFFTSIMKGQTAVGQPFELGKEALNRVTPMFIQDMIDLYKEGGLADLPLGIPGFFGAGVQTYGYTPTSQKEKDTSARMKSQGISENDISNFLLKAKQRKITAEERKQKVKETPNRIYSPEAVNQILGL